MILRKVNAVVSLFITVMLLNHAICHALWMLTSGKIALPQSILPWMLFGLMMLHAVISIVLAVLGHKGAEKRKCKEYPKLNKATIFQRMSGVSLIIFTALHVLGTVGILEPPYIIHAILPPIFFAVVLMHTAISGSKAFITLGIGSAKAIGVIDIAIKLICGITLIADVIGFYLYI